jgi:hypothetical protein
MKAVAKIDVPLQSVLAVTLKTADFFDAYQIKNPNAMRLPVQIWLDVLGKIPAWIDNAMRLRNFIVSKVGLRDAGKLSNGGQNKPIAAYEVGDRVGIFIVSYISDTEVVMGDDDKHLAVQVSLCKTASDHVVISTVVHIHNWFGHVYMLFVKPMHRIIVPVVLSKI